MISRRPTGYDTVPSAREPTIPTVTIRVTNPGAHGAASFPVRCGAPLPRGLHHATGALALHDERGPIAHQLTPLARWQDGSLRWVLVECLVAVPPGGEKRLFLRGRALAERAADEAGEAPPLGHRAVSATARADSPIPQLALEAAR